RSRPRLIPAAAAAASIIGIIIGIIIAITRPRLLPLPLVIPVRPGLLAQPERRVPLVRPAQLVIPVRLALPRRLLPRLDHASKLIVAKKGILTGVPFFFVSLSALRASITGSRRHASPAGGSRAEGSEVVGECRIERADHLRQGAGNSPALRKSR